MATQSAPSSDKHTKSRSERDLYLDALRAGALLVVVFGHWIATLPRFDGGLDIQTEHLLKIWEPSGFITWFVQVVPLFVFVSATVSADGVAHRMAQGHRQMHWWAGRALALARPTVTYLAAITLIALLSLYTGGRVLGPFNQSLTIHLWFLIMLLAVQALLPLSVEADRRWGLGAVVGLVVAFEMRRKQGVVTSSRPRIILAGGFSLMAGLVVSLALGALPGALLGLVGVAAASWLLRVHPQPGR
ncbi:acyltransferase family protein [Marinobacter sp. LQ44]|uniref:acyltransferase family protein n=1 Tax=unclassified Marinobacter TaxID=83889 RepID=UPI000718E2B3|nr:acyltransferase family protein [Marinobacter sp. LQ44]AMQ90312.1 hypothetical protein ASQ50_17325 [Marinobacter sp. LQ44]